MIAFNKAMYLSPIRHISGSRQRCALGIISEITRRALVSTSSPSSSILNDIKGPHGCYLTEHNLSIDHPELFWGKAAQSVTWYKNPSIILDNTTNKYMPKWFPDGTINVCYNCLDVHVHNGRGDQNALVYDSPLTGNKAKYTYKDVLDQVSRFAGVLQGLGLQQGDRVVIYMPMIPEAIIAMLACCRIGCVHSVVFGGFAAKELATRITDCQPKVIISASVGVEPKRLVPYKPLLDKALELATHTVQHCVIVQRSEILQDCTMGPLDLDYHELMQNSSPIDAVPLPANHEHYILYTSGTTGIPKGVVRDTAGTVVSLKYTMSAFYNTNPGETFFAASDIGWVVGHSYIVYGPLLNGCTTVLYEGKPVGTPDAGAFWRIIDEYKVKTMFVAPTAFRAIKQADPTGLLVAKYDLSSLRSLFLAGEHSDPPTMKFCEDALVKYGIKPIDHWWQTELGHPGVGNAVGLGHLPTRYGSCGVAAPGYDVRVLDDQGIEQPKSELGNLAIRLPLPPGTLVTLFNNHDRYIRDYLTRYDGFYDTGDSAFLDKDGYIHIMGRRDDLINVAGHRLSTGGIEEILQSHPDVADCAVIGVKDSLKGQVPIGFVLLKSGSSINEDQLETELVELVRHEIGPVAFFKKVSIVKALPKTRSGKILRGTMAKIANGEAYEITPTIEDPDIFSTLEPLIRRVVER